METRIMVVAETGDERSPIEVHEVEEKTFRDLGWKEKRIEEFIRCHVGELFKDADETLLMVGQQVRNEAGGTSDLIAVDGEGNLVLIELKRDATDMKARKEPMEFQAIRYAASLALIRSPDELVDKVFKEYVQQHRSEFKDFAEDTDPAEFAYELLDQFLEKNDAHETFNRRQRILLIASSFDEQTLSAAAWLARNNIDIRCLQLRPFAYEGHTFLRFEQIIPPDRLEDFMVDLATDSPSTKRERRKTSGGARAQRPKIEDLLRAGLIQEGDEVYVRINEEKTATVGPDGMLVLPDGRKMRWNEWGQMVTGWAAINVYEWFIHKPSGKLLDELREDLESAKDKDEPECQ